MRSTAFIVLFAFVLFLWTADYGLRTAHASGLLLVRPAKIEIDIAPGETKEVSIAIENTTPEPLALTITAEDVESGKEDERPFALIEGRPGAFSLKGFLAFPQSQVTLRSGEKTSVPVRIRIPGDARPGGRYGAVTVAFRPSAPAGGAVVPESAIAVLFFVRVGGASAKEDGVLARFGVFNDRLFVPVPSAAEPLRFQIAYENKGTVHLNPYGRMTISPIVGDDKVIIVDPWAVLPQSTRMREFSVVELGPGFYRAQLEQNRGYQDIVDENTVSIFVYPGPRGIFALTLALTLFTWLLWRSIRISKHFTR